MESKRSSALITALRSGVLRSSLFVFLTGVSGLFAQSSSEIFYYRFDEAKGSTAANDYAASKRAPAQGNIVQKAKKLWVKGRFGTAMQGAEPATATTSAHNYLDTGFVGKLSGSLTICWHMKRRSTLQSSKAYYFVSGEGLFRIFTNGIVSKGLSIRGWGGADIDFKTDVQGGAVTEFQHLAVVIDGTKKKAELYLDGVSKETISIAVPVSVPARKLGFRVGAHTRLATTSFWDLDEFRLLERAASVREIAHWSTAVLSYGKGCGATLSAGTGGLPRIGNAQHRLALKATANTVGILAVGLSDQKLFGVVPLPMDLVALFPGFKGKGCFWLTSSELFFPVTVTTTGDANLPFPIPAQTALLRISLYNQCLVGFGKKGKEESSNGLQLTILPK